MLSIFSILSQPITGKAPTRTNPLSNIVSILDNAKAASGSGGGSILSDSLRTKLDDAQKAARTMADTAKAMRRSRSGQASTRLKQLIDQVKILRLMGGDPKIMAKRAAELAKEIAAAAKEFTASADGNSPDTFASTASSTSGSAAPAAPQAAPNAPEAGAAAAKDSAAEANPDSVAEANKAIDEAHQAEQQAGAATPATAQNAPAADGEAKPGTPPADPAQAQVQAHKDETERVMKEGAAHESKAKAIDEEQRFFNEVKAALSALRAITQRAAAEAKKKHDNHGEQEAGDQLKEVKNADKELEAAVATIGQHGEGDTSLSSPATAANEDSHGLNLTV